MYHTARNLALRGCHWYEHSPETFFVELLNEERFEYVILPSCCYPAGICGEFL